MTEKERRKKFKKDKRRHQSRSASSDGSNASNDGQRSTAGGPSQGSVMMMRSWTGPNVSSERSGLDLSPTVGAAPESRQGTRSVTLGRLQVEPRDLWLLDAGATSTIRLFPSCCGQEWEFAVDISRLYCESIARSPIELLVRWQGAGKVQRRSFGGLRTDKADACTRVCIMCTCVLLSTCVKS